MWISLNCTLEWKQFNHLTYFLATANWISNRKRYNYFCFSVGKEFVWKFLKLPTFFWILNPWTQVDTILDGCSFVGIFLSLLTFATGRANSIVFFTLWAIYLSIVNSGAKWYNFGWDSQLLETGFLAIWTVPFLTWSKLPKNHSPSWVIRALFRWLIIRVSLGTGLARIKAEDSCWRNLKCNILC